MNRLLKYISLILIFTACEKKFDWPLASVDPGLIVIDGIITNEEKHHEIRLSYPVMDVGDAVLTISGATVLVSGDSNSYSFIEDSLNPGNYISQEAFQGEEGKYYSLLISKDDEIYTAKAKLIRARDFTPLRYTQVANGKKYKIQWVAPPYNAQFGAMYEILLDWSHLSVYADSTLESTQARLLYYTLPSLDVSEIFAPEPERIVFPEGTRITEKRYSLSEDHTAYVRAVLLETTWNGGLFGTTHDNVPTNLSNGAIGFFGACGVTTKEFVVTASDAVGGN